jgi:hypothetical protein
MTQAYIIVMLLMILMMFMVSNCFTINKYNINKNKINRSKRLSQTNCIISMVLGSSRGKEKELQLLQQQQQQQEQKQLMYFQSGLIALVIFITSYLGFMQNQMAVVQHDQTTAIDKLTVVQHDQATAIDKLAVMQNQMAVVQHDQATAIDKLAVMQNQMVVIQQIQSSQLNAIDSKLNSIFGGSAVVVGILTFIKYSQDVALNNAKLRDSNSEADNKSKGHSAGEKK